MVQSCIGETPSLSQQTGIVQLAGLLDPVLASQDFFPNATNNRSRLHPLHRVETMPLGLIVKDFITRSVRVFSREAAVADSCGRRPADRKPLKNTKPRSGDSKLSRESLSPLRGSKVWFWPGVRGLTPTAICCHRFAIPENVQLQNLRFGL
jgi:hypothetical protein